MQKAERERFKNGGGRKGRPFKAAREQQRGSGRGMLAEAWARVAVRPWPRDQATTCLLRFNRGPLPLLIFFIFYFFCYFFFFFSFSFIFIFFSNNT